MLLPVSNFTTYEKNCNMCSLRDRYLECMTISSVFRDQNVTSMQGDQEDVSPLDFSSKNKLSCPTELCGLYLGDGTRYSAGY